MAELVQSEFYYAVSWMKYLYFDSNFNEIPGFTVWYRLANPLHYSDVNMDTMASQITSLTNVYSIVYAPEDQRKHQSSASLALCG